MSKAITGAVELAGAVGLGVLAAFNPALIASPWFDKALAALVMSGIASEASAIAGALQGNRAQQIANRQAASNRQIVYGTQMAGGVLIYESTTGHQYNQIIVLAGHVCHSILNIYLDGRQVYFTGSGSGWGVRNGVGFGGNADHNDHLGPDGITKYNFGGLVYVEARYGDQPSGDYIQAMTANDPTWAPNITTGDSPSLMGCTYIYLKMTASSSQFPQRPEVKVLLNGKSDIYDPRTQLRGFTNNAALVLADVVSDTQFGLGDPNINSAQLIAAANICDEQVAVAAMGGSTESRYCCDYHYDTGSSPSDIMNTMLTGMAGRMSYVGGEYYIFPGAYIAPTKTFDESSLTAAIDWNPYRSIRDLPNRVTGTHTSPEWPFNVFGNYYKHTNQVENNFDQKFTATSFPYYAQDSLHGYPSDEWLTQDNGHERPLELSLPTVLSVTQCQRVAKINLLRQRARQGSGTLEMNLSAYTLQPCDTMNFSFQSVGWTQGVLEVVGTALKVDKVDTGDNEDAYAIRYTVTVQETDPSIYAWSTIEELTVYSAPAAPTQTPLVPNPPTNMQLSSGPQTAFVGDDGSVVAVIQVNWDTPLDNAAVGILIQYQLIGQTNWYYAPTADISLDVGLISPVIAGLRYNVRIATVRANGAISDWVEQDNFLVPALDTFLGQLGSKIPQIEPIIGLMPSQPGADKTSTNIPTELLINGSFEVGMSGWTLGRNSATPVDPNQHHSGSASARLRGSVISQTVALTVGHTYLLQAWIKTDGSVVGNGAIGAGFSIVDPGQNVSVLSVVGGVQVNVNGVNPGVVLDTRVAIDWTLIQMTFTVNANGNYPVFFEDDYGSGALNANAWLDDASLTDTGTSQELLTNGGFESGFIGWSIVVFPPLDPYQHKFGTNALILLGGQVSQGVFLLSDHTYTIQAWVKTDGNVVGNGSLGAGFSFNDPAGHITIQKANGTVVNAANQNPGVVLAALGPNDWALLQMTFHCNTSGVFTLTLTDDYGTTNANANVWFDGVSLVDTTGGADVTSVNTSNDTSFVSGVPSGIIASVVPTGYKLYINNGNKSYSIEAI